MTHRCERCGQMLRRDQVRASLVAGYPPFHFPAKPKPGQRTCGPVARLTLEETR